MSAVFGSISQADLGSVFVVFQVQGMSFIAAVLILNLEEAEAFITFANLLNKPCQMAFFRVDHELVRAHTLTANRVTLFSVSSPPSRPLSLSLCQMLKYFAAFEVFFEENLPRLFSHFQTNNLTPDLYLIDWWVITQVFNVSMTGSFQTDRILLRHTIE